MPPRRCRLFIELIITPLYLITPFHFLVSTMPFHYAMLPLRHDGLFFFFCRYISELTLFINMTAPLMPLCDAFDMPLDAMP